MQVNEFDLDAGIFLFSHEKPFQLVQVEEVASDHEHETNLFYGPGPVRIVLPTEAYIRAYSLDTPPAVKPIQREEIVDPVPDEALLTEPRPLTIQEQIQLYIRQAKLSEESNEESETFEEADDLDVDIDQMDLPLSPYEVPEGDPEDIDSYAEVPPDDKEKVSNSGVEPASDPESEGSNDSPTPAE